MVGTSLGVSWYGLCCRVEFFEPGLVLGDLLEYLFDVELQLAVGPPGIIDDRAEVAGLVDGLQSIGALRFSSSPHFSR